MKYFFITFLILFLFFSCKKDDIKPSWDTDLLVPIAFTQLSITDLLADSLEKINSDNTISLVYQTRLADFTLDTLIKLPDTNFQYVVNLNQISLNPFNYNYSVSMGSIAMKDKEQNGSSSPLYTAIMTAHNTGQPTQLTSFGPFQYDSVEIDLGNYFKYIYIRQATLEITIKNQLPIALTNLAFKLEKASTQEVLISDQFQLIPPNTQQSKSITLNNIVIDSLLFAYFTVSSPGTVIPVTIDTSQSATAIVSLKNLEIDSAIARFPSQELLKYNNVLKFNLPDSMQITETWIKTGILELNFYNTIKQNLHIDFQLPAAKKNGQPLQLQITIPASDGITASHISREIDFSQYKIKFRGIHEFEVIQGDLNNNNIIDQDTVNTLYYKLTASIDSTGEFITLTKNDSISATCRFLNIVPEYIRGFFGYKELNINGSSGFSFINNLQVQTLHFNQANFSITLENQIGTTAKAYIDELTAENSIQNQQITLQGSVLNTPFTLQKPNDPQNSQIDVIPTINTFEVNHNNSNINDLISILPNNIKYNFKLKVNEQIPMPLPATANDFVYSDDKISAKLNIEVPLSFYANKLILCDTVQTNFKNINTQNIQDGNIILHSKNYFPIKIDVYIYAMDSNKVVFDSLHVMPFSIFAGQINNLTQRVENPFISKNIIPLGKTKLNNILKSKYFLIKAQFNTMPQNQHIKIYDFYKIHLKLIGDFNYIIDTKPQ
jgi:hypothetical protein